MTSLRRIRRFAGPLLFIAAGCSGDPSVDMPDDSMGPRIISFTAMPQKVRAGATVTLTWETVGTNGVSIEPQVGLQPASGTVQVKPTKTTDYTLRVNSPGGLIKSSVRVEVEGGPPTIDAFTATPQTIMPGDSSILEWTASNASHVTIEPGVGMQPSTGSVTVNPVMTTTYVLTAVGDEGTAMSQVQIVVATGNQPFILSFTAAPQTVASGGAATLAWEVANADNVTISNVPGLQAIKGMVTVNPAQTTTYTLTAVGAGGSVNASVTINVTLAGDPTVLHFNATPTTVPAGGKVTLDWETDNATHVTITNINGMLMAKGDAEVFPQVTTTYTLTAFGNNKQVTRDVTVTVAGVNDPVVLEFTAQPQAVQTGGSTTLSWRTQNATSVDIDNGVGTGLGANDSIQVSPTGDTTYTLTARGAMSNAMATITVTVQAGAPQVVSFAATPASIVAGQNTTISWQTTGATSVAIDQGVGMQPANGSTTVSPTQTTLYTLTATGPGGQTTSLLTVTVTNAGAPTITAFTVMPQQITPGGQATLSWQTTDAIEVSIDNGIGVRPTNGQAMVSPRATTTYTLVATGPGGTTNSQVTLNVLSQNGDQCTNAFVINQSGQFTGNTQTAVNDYDPTRTGCTGFSAQGPDVVYQVTMQSGDRLVASLTPGTPSWDASLYLVRNCGDVTTSCVAGQDNGNPEMIDYTAAVTGDFFLIVDGFRAGGAYTLDVQLNTAPITNDQCSGAIDATMGGNFSGTTRGATNDYDPGFQGCTGFTARSGDVAYRVDLQVGERLQASLLTTWDSALYVVSDCAMAAATCLDGQDNGNPEQVDFTATTAGSYFLIVDGYGTFSGGFSLNVIVSPPVVGGDTCLAPVMVPAGGGSFQSTTTGLAADYDPPLSCTGYPQAGADRVYATMLGAGDVVEVAVEFEASLDGSVYVTTDCANLANSCVAGADRELDGDPETLRFVAAQAGPHFVIVDAEFATSAGAHDATITHYTAETCQDAAPLLLGTTSEPFTTASRVNDYAPGASGCTGAAADGADRAYSVTLRAGDQLQATVDPSGTYDASVYLVSDCGDVNGSCVAGRDTRGTATEVLGAVVQQAGTYFLIVDGFGSEGAGTITATIAHGDTCGDAYIVPSGGGRFMGTTTGYAANYGTTTRTGSCTNWEQEGPDAVYRVQLAAGERLQASLQTNWDANIYLITDCAASATTCVAGQDDGSPEELDYTNSTGATQTYFLVVDGWRPDRFGNYTLDVTIN